jgi:hypothetical protein
MQKSVFEIRKAEYPTTHLINQKINTMSTEKLSNEEIILRSQKAKSIADKIAEETNFDFDEFEEFTYALLTDNGKDDSEIVTNSFQTIIVEIMSLLTNPKVSSQLSEFSQKNAGKHLNSLYEYFSKLELCETQIAKRCDFINLKHLNYHLSERELNRLEQKYAKMQVA